MEIQLLASDLTAKGEFRVRGLDGHAAAALHVGSGASLNPKVWACEDSLTLLRLEDGSYLAGVADAHWGGGAGETVARDLARTWEEAGPGSPDPLTRLHRSLLALEAVMLANRAPEDTSETTVLLAHLTRGADGLGLLSYVSVGDSFLLLIDLPPGKPPGCRLANRLNPFYLGVQPLAALPQSPIDAGAWEVRPGQIVLLSSDGLEMEASRLEPRDVARELADSGTLEERLGRLLLLATDPDRDAGRDNLALIALEV